MCGSAPTGVRFMDRRVLGDLMARKVPLAPLDRLVMTALVAPPVLKGCGDLLAPRGVPGHKDPLALGVQGAPPVLKGSGELRGLGV